MGLRMTLVALGAALLLSGCAQGQYGYVYCSDPYYGVRGYYTGPFEPAPACAAPAAGTAYFAGPYSNGLRPPYFSGPYYSAPGGAPAPAPEPVSPAAVR